MTVSRVTILTIAAVGAIAAAILAAPRHDAVHRPAALERLPPVQPSVSEAKSLPREEEPLLLNPRAQSAAPGGQKGAPRLGPPRPAAPRTAPHQPHIAAVPIEDHPHAANGAVPWWHDQVLRPLDENRPALPVNLESLILDALRHSPQVRAISDLPLLHETAILEAHGEFDPRAFMESKYVFTSEPVGNTLITGGPPRYRDRNWTYKGGLAQKVRSGATWELSQQLGWQNNNSVFFVPPNQGTTRLALSFTQPLLNGAGKVYNSSLIVLAELETGIAWDQSSSQLQNHLLRLTETYWTLYLHRAVLAQKRRWYEEARAILRELEARREIDSLASQVARARAAVAARYTELARAEAAVRDAEAQIRALVNAPQLAAPQPPEMIPSEPPAEQPLHIELRDALVAALEHRPEIDEAMKRIRAAEVRLQMSKNELLPVLNVVLETYVMGLQGDSDIAEAWTDQFSQGEPSFTAGLVFETPLDRRAARARHARNRLALRQLVNQFQATVETLKAEVEIAVREVHTTRREVQSRYQAMLAAQADLRYLKQRWQLLPGDDRAASFLLEDLLDAQDRLTYEEFAFVEAQTAHTLALVELKRVTGTLLQAERITPQRVVEGGVPQIQFQKMGPPAADDAPGPAETIAPGEAVE